ncbi:uncharacterized protein EV420DRAFT_1478349 [Desarmillaria tabescens]|uniref:Uncharacterized protein n=1 Tax=Armillaria tabescens TaxID=1929756 RepID=A0AA39N7Q7_ARMTA|nr:uncharacterized protein EV420DRAFT_1478349 [Desarmillaria tabescens]KAK0460579.1 hypothetical protein EV420DRAFT_1478349 [Desarmillaria tabescens]
MSGASITNANYSEACSDDGEQTRRSTTQIMGRFSAKFWQIANGRLTETFPIIQRFDDYDLEDTAKEDAVLAKVQVILVIGYEEILVEWPTPQRQRETLGFGTCSMGSNWEGFYDAIACYLVCVRKGGT